MSSHAESEHGLRVQLATALRERDEQKARADAAEAELASLRAEFKNTVLFHNGRVTEHDSALAAARRECEELRGAVALHLKCPEEAAVSCLAEIRDEFSVVDSALAAPGAASGEEK